MNLLIDTNIILDILLKRKPHYKDSARIIALSEKSYFHCFISASAVTDIFYIAKKELKSKDEALGLIKTILKTVRIASLTETNVYEAIDLKWDDFEDSVQYVVGQSISAECIITRNPKDFSNSQLKVMSPEDFINQMYSNFS